MNDSKLMYPHEWHGLKHPAKRAELLATLQAIAEMDKRDIPDDDRDEIDSIYHTLFDDSDLGQKPDAEIGYMLFDQNESKAVGEVARKLDDLLKALGDSPTKAFCKHLLWPQIMESARTALERMSLRGTPFPARS